MVIKQVQYQDMEYFVHSTLGWVCDVTAICKSDLGGASWNDRVLFSWHFNFDDLKHLNMNVAQKNIFFSAKQWLADAIHVQTWQF